MNNWGGQVPIRILCILFGVLLNLVIVHIILLLSITCAVLVKEYIAYVHFWTTNITLDGSVYCTRKIGCRGFHWSEILQALITALMVGTSIIIINAHLILLFCITILRIRVDMYQLLRMRN